MKNALVSLLFATTLAGCAHAGPPAPERRHFSSPKEAARELTRSILPTDAYTALIRNMSQQMLANMLAGRTDVDPSVSEKLRMVVEECLPYDEMVEMNAQIYSERFTTEELEEAYAFYGTPTGVKFAKNFPEVAAEAMKRTLPAMEKRMPAAMKKHGLAE